MLTIAGLLCPPLLLDILNFIVDIRVRRSGAGTEQGAGDYRNGLGCGAGFSLQYSLLCLRCRVFDVVTLGWVTLGAKVVYSSRICCGALSASVQ